MSKVYERMVPSWENESAPVLLNLRGVTMTDRDLMVLAKNIHHRAPGHEAVRHDDNGIRIEWKADIIGIPLVLAKWDNPRDPPYIDRHSITGRGWRIGFIFERNHPTGRYVFNWNGWRGCVVEENLDNAEAFRRDYTLIILSYE